MPEPLAAWLRSLPGRPPLAVVTGSSVNALSFARSLGRRGVPVLALDSDRHLGIHTRYARVLQLPAVDEASQLWIDVLDSIGRSLETPPVLFPTSDRQTLLLSEQQDRLRPLFRLLLPDPALVRTIVNKRTQYELAAQAGVAVPASRYPESMEAARRLAAEVAYPCILKPCESQSPGGPLSGRKLSVVHSAAQLLEGYDRFAASGVAVMVQEIIPGSDQALVSYLGLWSEEGREVAWITKRKLRQFPPGYGDGSLQRTEELPEVAELSRRLLRGVGYRGFASVEFKYDESRRRLCLIEINPRSSAMNQLAVCAGVDLPWIAYRLLTGESRETPAPSFRPDVTCVNEEWDVQALLALRASGEIDLRTWLRSLRRSRPVIGAWDDPLPLASGLIRAIGLSLRSVPAAFGGGSARRP